MRRDLDTLMAERHIDAFIIPGDEGKIPHRDYITGGVHASAIVIKKVNTEAVLIVSGMERDEAAKSGLRVMTYEDFNWGQIRQEHGVGTAAAAKAFWTACLDTLEVGGRVTLYGTADVQRVMRMIDRLNGLGDRIEIVTDETRDIFSLAYQTKDADEVEKLREAGRKTSAVMRIVRDWLSTHRADGEQIVNGDGQALTIGDVKRYVRLKLLEHDMEDANGMIFAQGRDAGVPHSRGEADEVLRPGESIVFDLFPRPVGGGYYHDMTRTWSLGYAREDVQRDFDLVLNVFHRSLEGINIGEPTTNIGRQVCEWFEAQGHPTRLNTPNTQEGYVHSLGHGLGLNVHEAPGIRHLGSDEVIFEAGNVVTIEPGLYYPDKGYGIRVEDTIYIDDDGQLHNLTDCPYDLVVPLRS